MRSLLRSCRGAAGLLLLGFLCALCLCVQRMALEAQNSRVCAVMTSRDAALLDGTPASLRLFEGEAVLDGALLLVEDENQHSYRPHEALFPGYTAGGEASRVRCFLLDGAYAARYGTLGYAGAEEIENMLYRAVTDRNIRVLWLTPFVDARSGETVTDSAVYEAVLQNLARRIARHGLTLGDSFSVFPEREPHKLLLAGCFAGVCGAGWLLLAAVFSWGENKKRELLLLFLSVGGSLAAAFFLTEPAVTAASLAASVCFPCLAVYCAIQSVRATDTQLSVPGAGAFLRLLMVPALISLAGGLFIGGMMSSTDYLLAVRNFRGVKLSQALPLMFSLLMALRYLCRPGELWAQRRRLLPLLALFALAAVYYLIRTGNAEVSVLEQRARNLLELILPVRPRTKEFLIAWPALGLGAALAVRGRRELSFPFTVFSAVGFSSVVNTFCHARAPVWVSLTRGLTGLLIGGLLALGLYMAARRQRPLRQLR